MEEHHDGVVNVDKVYTRRKKPNTWPAGGDITKKVKLENGVKEEGTDESLTGSTSNSPPSDQVSLQNFEAEGVVVDHQFATVLKYGMAAVRGNRDYMEDAVSVHPLFCKIAGDEDRNGELHFFAVFDGHGCSHVSTLCKKRMHKIVKEEILREKDNINWEDVMKRSFMRMDIETDAPKPAGFTDINTCRCKQLKAGSTAVVAVLTPDKIIVAHCGDSRALLCRKATPFFATVDHKPDRPDELRRIEAMGGRVIFCLGAHRVSGILAMSRAIGDKFLKPFILSEPEVTVVARSIEADNCLILATDGLWDWVTSDQACCLTLYRMKGKCKTPCTQLEGDLPVAEKGSDETCADAATSLAELALNRGKCDNISVVVVDLMKPIIN